MEGCMSVMCSHQHREFFDEMYRKSAATISPPNLKKHDIIDRS